MLAQKIVALSIAFCFFAPLFVWFLRAKSEKENGFLVELTELPFLLFAFGIGIAFLASAF